MAQTRSKVFEVARQDGAEYVKRLTYEADVEDALNAAILAIDEYYNGDRKWAEVWLLKAFAANRPNGAKFDRAAYQKAYMKTYMPKWRKRQKERTAERGEAK